MRRVHRDERGLVLKAMAFGLIVLVLVGIAAVDAGSIFITKYNLAQLAQDAAFQGALQYRTSESRGGACDAAEEFVAQEDPDARIPEDFCEVDTQNGHVTVSLRKTAGTFVAKYFDFLEKYTRVEESGESGALR